MQLFKGNPYHPYYLKKDMIENIPGSGLAFEDLQRKYSRFGKEGLIALLSQLPSSSPSQSPRVTTKARILATMVKYFQWRKQLVFSILSFYNWWDITVIILVNTLQNGFRIFRRKHMFSVAMCIMRMRAYGSRAYHARVQPESRLFFGFLWRREFLAFLLANLFEITLFFNSCSTFILFFCCFVLFCFFFCETFQPRSHFKSRLSLIVRVNVVLNRTVVVDSDWRFNNLCGSHLQSQSELYHVSWWYSTLVIDLIGQLRRDVFGCLSVKPWCYWLWRLVIGNWCVSIRLLSQLNSCLLLVKMSVLQSFSRS